MWTRTSDLPIKTNCILYLSTSLYVPRLFGFVRFRCIFLFCVKTGGFLLRLSLCSGDFGFASGVGNTSVHRHRVGDGGCQKREREGGGKERKAVACKHRGRTFLPSSDAKLHPAIRAPTTLDLCYIHYFGVQSVAQKCMTKKLGCSGPISDEIDLNPPLSCLRLVQLPSTFQHSPQTLSTDVL